MASGGHKKVETICRDFWTTLFDYMSNEEKSKKKPLPQRSGELERRRVPLKEVYRLDKYKIRKLSTIGPHVVGPSKTILVIGQTGSGKTTLIDGMFNYISHVKWEDPYRWQLTDLTSEEEAKGEDETVSCTEWLTIYSLPKAEDQVFPYCLNIIDTPGFGDTRGIEHDRDLVKNLTHFFNDTKAQHEILAIDAVCFVVRAPDIKLTTSQGYVFNAVMSIFGKDIKENIFAMATFADGKKPKVLKALEKEEIHIEGYFKFNNSALFSKQENEEEEEEDDIDFIKKFWDIGKSSYKKFFDKLILTESKSTKQTAEVLCKRQQLEAILDIIKTNVSVALNEMDKLRLHNTQLERCLKEGCKDKNAQIESMKMESGLADNAEGVNTLYCNNCEHQCHYPCARYPLLKYFCPVFDLMGKCNVCHQQNKGKVECKTSDHKFTKTHDDRQMIRHNTTLEKLQQQYKRTGSTEGDSLVNTMDEINKEYRQYKDKVHKQITEGKACYDRIAEISLKEDPLSNTAFIDQLIKEEMSRQKDDRYMERVKMLKEIRSTMTHVEDVKSGQAILSTVKSMEEFEAFRRHSQIYNPIPEKS